MTRLRSISAITSLLLFGYAAEAKVAPPAFVAKTKEAALYCEAIYLDVTDLPDNSSDYNAAAYRTANKARGLYEAFSGKSEAEIMADVDKAVSELKDLNYTDQSYRDMATRCDAMMSEIDESIRREGYQ